VRAGSCPAEGNIGVDRPASVFRAEGGPTLGLTCAAGGHVKRDERRHVPRMKNAPGLWPHQRRQVQAMLGGGCDT